MQHDHILKKLLRKMEDVLKKLNFDLLTLFPGSGRGVTRVEGGGGRGSVGQIFATMLLHL